MAGQTVTQSLHTTDNTTICQYSEMYLNRMGLVSNMLGCKDKCKSISKSATLHKNHLQYDQNKVFFVFEIIRE